jgi:hypothetical protein
MIPKARKTVDLTVFCNKRGGLVLLSLGTIVALYR